MTLNPLPVHLWPAYRTPRRELEYIAVMAYRRHRAEQQAEQQARAETARRAAEVAERMGLSSEES